jgi:hypothetical protein
MAFSLFMPPVTDPDAIGKSATLVQQGTELLHAFRLDDAEPLLRRALALAPDSADALFTLAVLHQRRGTNPAAQMDLAFRALSIQSDHAAAHKVFALACRAHGLDPLAVGHLRRCIELDPRDSNAFFHLGLTLLQFGRWEDGWRTYEQRPTMDEANGYTKPAPTGTTEWQGQDLRGKSIALLGEDGHGDQIQNLRFAAQVLALGPRRVVLDIRPALRRLLLHALRAAPGGEVVTAATLDEARSDIDYVLACGSLGARFGANATNLSANLPYLRPATPPRPRPASPARVGLVWRGAPYLDSDRVRSITLPEFLPLLQLAGRVQWVSLQHDDHRPDELAIIHQHGIQTPLRSGFDFLDTAGIVADLDLVIAVDTAIVHLAGSMGKPVWLLNRATSEWRWGWKRATSPWYPTLRMFNQDKLLDWEPVLRDVRDALAPLV